ncbi:MAG: PTS system mannose/fructose/sorbose family transporter subunit IID [Gemmatimonadetes bacterium]|nr:PTS system mannose/fructose/sorbose family transporter subunit IID [Gemmatimonadota bacterium]
MRLLRSDHLAAWSRTFAIQGSWNYSTMVGAGIAYAVLPLLRRIHAGDPVRLRESVERSMRPFNGHPYLCAMAVAALGRLEQDEVDPQTIEKFRTALRGPLGTVGDRAVWGQWRPICVLAGTLSFLLGASAGWSAVAFLVLYNAGHVAVRVWAYVKGWQAGLEVGRLLKGAWLERWAERLWPVNILLTGGVALVLADVVVSQSTVPLASVALLGMGAIGALLAFRFPRQGGRAAAFLLVIAPLLWLLGGLTG